MAFVCLLGVGGCGQRRVEPTAVTSYENLGAINGAYSKATRTLNRPPKSLDELLPFLKEVGDPEAILRSPRDGEPYVIVWDVDLREKGPVPIFAYERLGKDGSRFISNGRIVSKMTNEDFGKANFPAGHRPSP